MFKKMRYKENELDRNSALEILKTGSYGVLSTIGDDGYPYGVPLNYTYANDCIYFHCANEGHKIDNIKNSESVSFCVVTKSEVLPNKFDTDYESAIVFGKATKVTENSEKEEILLSVLNKYSSEFMKAGKNYMKKYWDDTTVIKIRIENITGKARK